MLDAVVLDKGEKGMSLHTMSTLNAEAMRVGFIIGAITAAFVGIALLRAKNPAQGLDTLLIATTFVAGGLWWKHFHYAFRTLWVGPHSSEAHALLFGMLLSAIFISALVVIAYAVEAETGKGGVALSILAVGVVVAVWWWKYHYILRTLWDR